MGLRRLLLSDKLTGRVKMPAVRFQIVSPRSDPVPRPWSRKVRRKRSSGALAPAAKSKQPTHPDWMS